MDRAGYEGKHSNLIKAFSKEAFPHRGKVPKADGGILILHFYSPIRPLGTFPRWGKASLLNALLNLKTSHHISHDQLLILRLSRKINNMPIIFQGLNTIWFDIIHSYSQYLQSFCICQSKSTFIMNIIQC